jgi:hypothetical protein
MTADVWAADDAVFADGDAVDLVIDRAASRRIKRALLARAWCWTIH